MKYSRILCLTISVFMFMTQVFSTLSAHASDNAENHYYQQDIAQYQHSIPANTTEATEPSNEAEQELEDATTQYFLSNTDSLVTEPFGLNDEDSNSEGTSNDEEDLLAQVPENLNQSIKDGNNGNNTNPGINTTEFPVNLDNDDVPNWDAILRALNGGFSYDEFERFSFFRFVPRDRRDQDGEEQIDPNIIVGIQGNLNSPQDVLGHVMRNYPGYLPVMRYNLPEVDGNGNIVMPPVASQTRAIYVLHYYGGEINRRQRQGGIQGVINWIGRFFIDSSNLTRRTYNRYVRGRDLPRNAAITVKDKPIQNVTPTPPGTPPSGPILPPNRTM